jgi:glycosyltransferase involved in cell wall biosynthesis
MKKLLYIGNKLSGLGLPVTSIETLGSLLEAEGYTIWYASEQKRPFLRLMDMVIHTLRYGRSADYVLIDVYSTLNFWYAVVVSQLCRLLGVPYIAKLHGGDLPKRIEKSPFWADLVFKHAYKNVAPSQYLLQSFQKKYTAHLIYIPNTLVIDNYVYQSQPRLRPKLLWVRAWESIYNPELAMQTGELLKRNYPEVELCMVGPFKNISETKAIAMAARYTIPIRIIGGLTKEEWTALAGEYSIFLNSTNVDNTPVSVMEAMALGLPVVSTNVGGIPYLITDEVTGVLVPPNDPPAMAAAIERLLRNPDVFSAITTQALAMVEDFDWSVVKEMWKEVLR